MLGAAVLPVIAVFTPVYWAIWGPMVAFEHGVLSFAAGLLVTEYLLGSVDSMPCASPWRPERANLRGRWPVYTMVQVANLGRDDLLFEIDATAVLPSGGAAAGAGTAVS